MCSLCCSNPESWQLAAGSQLLPAFALAASQMSATRHSWPKDMPDPVHPSWVETPGDETDVMSNEWSDDPEVRVSRKCASTFYSRATTVANVAVETKMYKKYGHHFKAEYNRGAKSAAKRHQTASEAAKDLPVLKAGKSLTGQPPFPLKVKLHVKAETAESAKNSNNRVEMSHGRHGKTGQSTMDDHLNVNDAQYDAHEDWRPTASSKRDNQNAMSVTRQRDVSDDQRRQILAKVRCVRKDKNGAIAVTDVHEAYDGQGEKAWKPATKAKPATRADGPAAGPAQRASASLPTRTVPPQKVAHADEVRQRPRYDSNDKQHSDMSDNDEKPVWSRTRREWGRADPSRSPYDEEDPETESGPEIPELKRKNSKVTDGHKCVMPNCRRAQAARESDSWPYRCICCKKLDHAGEAGLEGVILHLRHGERKMHRQGDEDRSLENIPQARR